MLKVIEERYPGRRLEHLCAQASDGDNVFGDIAKCVDMLLSEVLMPLCQYFAYVEIIDERESESSGRTDNGTALWRAYRTITGTGRISQMTRIARPADIYPVFRKLFATQQRPARKSEGEWQRQKDGRGTP